MIRRSIVFALMSSGILSEFAKAQADVAQLQPTLEQLHREWFTAFDKGDGATMDRMEVPNLTLVMPDGTIWQKDGPRAGRQKPTGYDLRTLSKVQVHQVDSEHRLPDLKDKDLQAFVLRLFAGGILRGF